LPVEEHRLCEQGLREPDGSEGELAALRPVEPNCPLIVWPIEMHLLIMDPLPFDARDGGLVK